MKEKILASLILAGIVGCLALEGLIEADTIQVGKKQIAQSSISSQSKATHTQELTEKQYGMRAVYSELVTNKANTTITTKKQNKSVATTKSATTTVPKATTTIESSTQTTYNNVSYEQSTYYNVPIGMNFYGYMDYHCITDTNSAQYKFQQNCWTDSQGLRRQYNDYVVALGSYYSTTIGERFLVTLDTGITYTIVIGDCKADCDTNPTNQYTYAGQYINIIEFIVDTPCLDYSISQSGDIGSYTNLKGNVKEIVKIK